MQDNRQSNQKVVLITGAARRIGEAIARYFHARQYRVIVHFHTSAAAAMALVDSLNQQRPNSCLWWQCDLADFDSFNTLNHLLENHWQRLDVIIHNASSFMRTPIGHANLSDWNQLFDSNVKGAYFLTQMVLPWLRAACGNIVAITDIHATTPMRDYSLYCMSKSALMMMVKVLAKELAPTVRVNAVAPGVAALPEGSNSIDDKMQKALLSRIPLQRFGDTNDIAQAAWVLVEQCLYMTGQVLTIDGGRSLSV